MYFKSETMVQINHCSYISQVYIYEYCIQNPYRFTMILQQLEFMNSTSHYY